MSQYLTLKFKRGTASDWSTANPILAEGEPGFEIDTGKLKIGDGTTAWNFLSYTSALTDPDTGSVTLGQNAGLAQQGISTVAVGQAAGRDRQSNYAVAVGVGAGLNRQGQSAVAVGNASGAGQQGNYAVGIGNQAGYSDQGDSSVAIGSAAGYMNQPRNTIILNASGTVLNGVTGQTGSFYVKPIRTIVNGSLPSGFFNMAYNPTSSEIIYWS